MVKCKTGTPKIAKIMRGNLPARFCRDGVEFEHVKDFTSRADAIEFVKEEKYRKRKIKYRILEDVAPNYLVYYRLYKARKY